MKFDGLTFSLIGRPGCGKSTQCKYLHAYFEELGYKDIVHFSVGALFRDLAAKDTIFGHWTKKILDEGGLPPDWIALSLWIEELKNRLIKIDQILIIDGAPRRLIEAEALDNILKALDRQPVIPVNIEIDEKESRRRLAKRGRDFDDPKANENRLSWFNSNVIPVFNHWQNSLLTIDGNGPKEEVWERFKKTINS
jgi:adenylate kinase family enzyme